MGALAIFGIENDGLELAVNLLLLFLVVIWLALIYWTFSDARRRIADPLLVGCATAASAFPFVGTIVYLIVRPPEYLEDMRERELEIAAAEARLASLEHSQCPYCGHDVESDFLRCPSCLRRLKEPCTVCSRPLDPRWKICPYCESEIGQAAPEPRRTRPRRTAAASSGRQGSQRAASARTARQSEQSSDRAVAAERQRAERAERPVRASRERPPSAG
jgi:Double zinc ribbon